MAFDVAERLGEWDVDRMLEQMPAPLLDEWVHYFQVRAWEDEQAAKKQKG